MEAPTIEPGIHESAAKVFHVAQRRKPEESLAQLMDRLAVRAADAADADQWTIEFDGTERTSSSGFERLVPQSWLIALNRGRPAVYDVSFPLEAGGRQLGMLRLSTWRPSGFRPADLKQARRDANRAASL